MNALTGWQIDGSWVEIYETIFIPAMVGEWVPKVIALAKPVPGERILDIACGTGALTRGVAHSIGPHGQVIGLDINPDMLEFARKFPLNQSELASIEWREGDAQALPFQDETFDVVFCQIGLMFFPDQVMALREMRRVLKPAGRLGIMVWGSISQCPGQLAMKMCWDRYLGQEMGARITRQHSLGSSETIQSLLEEAGFTDYSVQAMMGNVRFPSAAHLMRSYGALVGMEVDEQTRANMIQEASDMLQPHVGADGLVYPIEAVLASARK